MERNSETGPDQANHVAADTGSTATDSTTAVPSRRRFLGHATRMAPAAIVTFNSTAALAVVRTSSFVKKAPGLIYSQDELDKIPGADKAEPAAYADALQDALDKASNPPLVDADGLPVCVSGPQPADNGQFADPAEYVDLTDISQLQTAEYNPVRVGADPAGSCQSGFNLVFASGMVSNLLKVV